MNISVQSELIWLRILVQICREQALQAEQLDFDAWYQRRRHQAHVAYMKRTGQHLVCDWRLTGTSSAEEIHQFFNTNVTKGVYATDC